MLVGLRHTISDTPFVDYDAWIVGIVFDFFSDIFNDDTKIFYVPFVFIFPYYFQQVIVRDYTPLVLCEFGDNVILFGSQANIVVSFTNAPGHQIDLDITGDDFPLSAPRADPMPDGRSDSGEKLADIKWF